MLFVFFFFFFFDEQAESEIGICRFHNSLVQKTMKTPTSANMIAHSTATATATAIPGRKLVTLRDADRG